MNKFNNGDIVVVCDNAGEKRQDFLKHFIEIGTVFTIQNRYYGWRNEEAYTVKECSEIFLAEELKIKK